MPVGTYLVLVYMYYSYLYMHVGAYHQRGFAGMYALIR